jgi:hypothetical protein
VDTFVRFADFDMYICSSPGEGCPDSPYDEWLKRQYITAIEWTGNAAKSAGTTVTASSQKAAAQSPEKARDGYAWGAPMDAATVNGSQRVRRPAAGSNTTSPPQDHQFGDTF